MPHARHTDPNLARHGVSHSVLDEVAQNLGDSNGIGALRYRRQRNLDLEAQPLGSCRICKRGTHVLKQLVELEYFHLRLQF